MNSLRHAHTHKMLNQQQLAPVGQSAANQQNVTSCVPAKAQCANREALFETGTKPV